MNQERLKQIAIGWRDPLYTFAIFLGCICILIITVVVIVAAIYLVPAIKDWRAASTATTKVYEAGLGSVTDAAQNVKDATAQVAPTLKGLQAVEKETQEYVSDLRGQTRILTHGLEARLQTLDTLLVSVRGVSDEARVQLKQNGDKATELLEGANMVTRTADAQIIQLGNDGSKLLRTADSRLAKVLDDFDVVIVGPDGLEGLVKKGNYIANETGKTTHNVNLLTSDIQAKTHSLLFPTPDKGFTGFVKKYILRPITTFGGAAYLVQRLLYNLP